jgi:hypothetical protein
MVHKRKPHGIAWVFGDVVDESKDALETQNCGDRSTTGFSQGCEALSKDHLQNAA